MGEDHANRKSNRNRSLRLPIGPTSKPSFAPISTRVRESPPRIYTGHISAFMAQQSEWSAWFSRQVGYPNFRPHQANSHQILAPTTGFGEQPPNLRAREYPAEKTYLALPKHPGY
ncbi:hypothetical protein AVEN_234493-1 [Araneus ventricosus]|uniref:Uncharacterized protein n=1 Tax=Araneus ventricosus TaxID=182803 RepID=A0A4Y2AAE0_ARAVE|nr:hypothetical protein AVEN_234493-1 [Araneus ventricosus]